MIIFQFCHIKLKVYKIRYFRFETMKVINQLCEFGKTTKITELLNDTYANEAIYDTIKKIAPAMNETFAFCKLFGEWINCSKIFFLSMHESGFCYSFNIFKPSERMTDE